MHWIEWIVRRPVLVGSFYLLGLLAAVAAVFRLPLALLPSLRFPAMMIWTAYPDVAPEQVERLLTERVEEAAAGIAGLADIESSSQLGGSLVRLDFNWSVDLDLAGLEVRERLERQAGTWPPGAERPLVFRIDPAQKPILILAVSAESPSFPAAELQRLATDLLARRLEQLTGVARVRVTGARGVQVEIQIDPDRANALGLGLEDVEAALVRANRSHLGGVVRQGPLRYSLEITGELADLEDVRQTLVSQPGSPPVRLHQIATSRIGEAPRKGLSRLDGREVVLLAVERRTDANLLETVAAVKSALAALRLELPELQLTTVVDSSIYVSSALANVLQSLILGALLAAVVIRLYIRQRQALIAVLLSLPTSLALTLVLFDLFAIGLNLMSLSGLALGVGMLVDNSLVVIEGIEHQVRHGVARLEAAALATSGLAGAVAASTLTTLAIFGPLVLVEGMAGRVFRDQAIAVVCSVAVSLLVALTLVPVLASRPWFWTGARTGTERPPSPGLRQSERILVFFLRHPWLAIAASAVFLALGGILAWFLPRAVVPEAHERQIALRLQGRPNADIDWLERRSAEIERFAALLPGVTHVLAELGERDDAALDVQPRLEYQGDLTLTVGQSAKPRELLARLTSLPAPSGLALEARLVQPPIRSLLVSSDSDLVIDLARDDSNGWDEGSLARIAAALGGLRELREVTRPQSRIPAQELQIQSAALLRYRVDPGVFETYLDTAVGGREVTRLRQISDDTKVVLRPLAGETLHDLLATEVPNLDGQRLPLRLFLEARPATLPAALFRHHHQSIARLTANLAPGESLRTAVGKVEETLTPLLPPDARMAIGGAQSAFQTSLSALKLSLALSILIVYLILAAQFESFSLPLLVLTCVPVAGAGACLLLAAGGMGWNLMSLTGLVVLVGICVNDAILKVDAIKQLRSAANPIFAVVRASRERFRAIVMTTVTTVLGLLPMSLALGDSGPLQAPMAVVITGGLIASTLFTTWIVPVLYFLFWGRGILRSEP